MDDTILKIAFIGGCFAALYIVGRRLSATPSAPEQRTASESALLSGDEKLEQAEGRAPAVGYEVPFPYDVRELAAKYGPDCNRPSILNYFFRKIDLAAGPPDPAAFYDELLLKIEDPGTGHRWDASFFVTTPKGLEEVMREDDAEFLFGADTIIVQRFDLRTILKAVLEFYMEAGSVQSQAAETKDEPVEPETQS